MRKLTSYIPGTKARRAEQDRRLCARARERVNEIVDGEVPDAREREELSRHLDACTRCGAGASEIRELKAAIARVGRSEDPQVVGRLRDFAQRLCEGTIEPGSD